MDVKKKVLTVRDATKDELIEFCFNPFNPRGVLMKEQFLLWLERKRNGCLLNQLDEAIDNSHVYLYEYIRLVQEANNEPDIDKKLEIFKQANIAYTKYEQSEELYKRTEKKLMDNMGL